VKTICQNINSFECKKLLKIHLEDRRNKIILLSEESWIKKSFNGQISFPHAKVDTGPFSTQVLDFLKGEKKEMNFDVTLILMKVDITARSKKPTNTIHQQLH
jgi:hypothetical protein